MIPVNDSVVTGVYTHVHLGGNRPRPPGGCPECSMQSTRSQRLTGLGLLVAGSAATWWQWHVEARIELALQGAFVFAFSAGTGLLLLVQPISRRWLLEHYGVDRPHRLGHYSWPQRLLFLLALLAGLLNVGRELLR